MGPRAHIGGFVSAGWTGLMLFLCLLSPRPVGAAGALRIRTLNPGVMDLPLVDEAKNPVSGPWYHVQVFATEVARDNPRALGEPIVVGSGVVAGYVAQAEDPLVSLEGFASGSLLRVELRAWNVTHGPTFGEAARNGSLVARSSTRALVTVPADGEVGTLSLGGTLRLFDPRQRRLWIMADQSGNLGTDLQLTLDPTESLIGPVEFEWLKDGESLGLGTNPRRIRSLTFADSGDYSARVTDAAGTILSSVHRVLVVPRQLPADVTPSPIRLGEGISVKLSMASNDGDRFQWLIGNRLIGETATPSLDLAQPELGLLTVMFKSAANRLGFNYLTTVPLMGVTINPQVPSAGGRVTWSPLGSSFGLPAGSLVRFEAVARPGYEFMGWIGTLAGQPNPVSWVLQQYIEPEPIFRPRTGTMNFDALGSGAVIQDASRTPLGGEYLAEVYVGTSENALVGTGYPVPVGKPSPGLLSPPVPLFLPGIAGGSPGFVQVRFWAASAGGSFEAALASGTRDLGWSRALRFVAGGGGDNPTPPAYITGFGPITFGKPAQILSSLPEVRAGIGQSVMLDLAVGGSAPIRYQWLHDGLEIPGATRSYLYLDPVRAEDVGEYRLRVSNLLATELSNAGRIVLLPAPRIRSFSASQNPTRGSPLRFTVTVDGGEDLEYLWFRDGQQVWTESPRGEFAIDHAESGKYSVLIRGPGGEVSQDLAVVPPVYRIEISASGGTVSREPALDFYEPGTRVVLEATPGPGASFTGWAGTVISSANPLELILNADQQLEARFLQSSGTVIFGNRNASEGPDAPIFDVDGVTRLEGPSYAAQLYAASTGGPLTAVDVRQRFRTGAAAGYLPSLSVVVPMVAGGDFADVQIRAWDTSTGASYEAAVASGGRHGESALLTVRTGNRGLPPTLPTPLIELTSFALHPPVAPEIVRGPDSTTGELGSAAQLAVIARGTEPRQYQWRLGDGEIPGATNRVLTVLLNSTAQIGEYRVEVRNPWGTVMSAAAALSLPGVLVEAETNLVGGHLEFDPPPGFIAVGKTVTARAVADPGYSFERWEPATLQQDNPRVFEVQGPMRLGARFRLTSGTFVFRNRDEAAAFLAPVRDPESPTGLADATYLAQAVGGTNLASLHPLGIPVALGADDAAGYFDGGVVLVPEVSGGSPVLLQVRAWEKSAGATFEEALRPGVRLGESALLILLTGNAGLPPTPAAALLGLESFEVHPAAPARVTVPPAPVTFQAGRTLELQAVVTGHPLPQLQWLKDGEAIPGATQTVWRVEVASLADAGVYALRASNVLGSETSPAAAAILSLDPLVRLTWTSTNVWAGESWLIRAQADGVPPFQIDWYAGPSGDTNLWLGSSAELFVPALFTTSSYWVRVRDARGVTDSPAVVVEVHRHDQTFAWEGPADVRFGDLPVPLPTLASSGLFIDWQVTAGPGEIQDGALAFLDAGEIRLRGSQAGDALYLPAPDLEVVVRVLPGNGAIRGQVFLDHDGNGRPDPGEGPAAEVQLGWVGRGLEGERTVRTDAEGHFEVLEVPPGKVTLQVDSATGWVVTTSAARGLRIAPQLTTEIAVGLQAFGSLQGVVYRDLDGDHVRGEGESGIAAAMVRLAREESPDQILRTATTAADGTFAFENLPAAAYRVEEVDPPGFVSSTPNLQIVEIGPRSAAAVTFGDLAAHAISGVIYVDLNGNGTHEPEEPGLPDVPVRVRRSLDEVIVAEKITGPGGGFAFADLAPGEYVVQPDYPGNYTLTVESGRPAQLAETIRDRATASLATGSGSSGDHTVVVEPGLAVTLPLGLHPVGTLTGMVFQDDDADGSPGSGEKGLGLVRLLLRAAETGIAVERTVSAAGGFFRFANLSPGNYEIVVTTPTGFGRIPRTFSVTATTAGAVLNVPLRPLGRVGGVVFHDLDADGRFAISEPGVAEMVIRWRTPEGAAVDARTDRDGAFEFVEAPGPSGVLTLVLPSGWEATTSREVVLSATNASRSSVVRFGVRGAELRRLVWQHEPADTQAAPGSKVTLEASVEGSPPIRYQWYKDGAEVPGAGSPTFSFGAVQPSDTGVYQLLAVNPLGPMLSRRVSLQVRVQDDYLAWARTQLTATADLSPFADPDADGQANLLEFVQGTSPANAGISGRGPRGVALPRERPTVIGFELLRAHRAASVVLGLEGSDDLVRWQPLKVAVTMVAPGAEVDVVQVLAPVNVAAVPRRFVRLTLQPSVPPAEPASLRIHPRHVLSGPPWLEMRGQPGRAYGLDRSGDLVHWIAIGEWITGAAPVLVPLEDSGNPSSQFYRATPR